MNISILCYQTSTMNSLHRDAVRHILKYLPYEEYMAICVVSIYLNTIWKEYNNGPNHVIRIITRKNNNYLSKILEFNGEPKITMDISQHTVQFRKYSNGIVLECMYNIVESFNIYAINLNTLTSYIPDKVIIKCPIHGRFAHHEFTWANINNGLMHGIITSPSGRLQTKCFTYLYNDIVKYLGPFNRLDTLIVQLILIAKDTPTRILAASIIGGPIDY